MGFVSPGTEVSNSRRAGFKLVNTLGCEVLGLASGLRREGTAA